MGARDETLELLQSGKSPSQIASTRQVSLKTTLGYLDHLVGEGRTRRFDIYSSLPKEIRRTVHEIVATCGDNRRKFNKACREHGLDDEDVEVVRRYGNPRSLMADMYGDLALIEIVLHDVIRKKLVQEYGPAESGWWKQGIPLPIREKCVARRESDDTPVESYRYTDLIDLRALIDKRWPVLEGCFPDRIGNEKKK